MKKYVKCDIENLNGYYYTKGITNGSYYEIKKNEDKYGRICIINDFGIESKYYKICFEL